MLLLALACKDGPTDTGDVGPVTIVLEGSGSAWDHLPSAWADEPSEWVETETVDFAADRLLVWLDEDTTVDDVNAAFGPHGAVVVGGDADLGLLELSVSAPGDVFVDVSESWTVAFDMADRTQALPPAHISPTGLDDTLLWEWATLHDGANWGLKSMKAPYAWNLPYVDGNVPRIAVLDNAFTAHDDIGMTVVQSPTLDDTDHGNMCASTIGGKHDDKGIEGVMPFDVDIQAHGIKPARTARKLAAMKTEVLAAKGQDRPLVMSMSLGLNYLNRTDAGFVHQDYPSTTLPAAFGGDGTITFQQAVTAEGKSFEAFEDRAVSKLGNGQWLMFCSAGNSNDNPEDFAYTASMNSGCAWAASTEGVAERFFAVEAITHSGATESRAPMSHTGGTLAAPGIDIGMASTSWYDVASGTSFATPYAAGMAALLWTWKPDAEYADVRRAMLKGREVAETAGAVDFRLALTELDPGHTVAMADVDDLTVDGASRQGEIDQYGDGCVDMADFRAFRDALLDLPAGTGNPNLNGDSPDVGLPYGRDHNRDDQLYWTALQPNWWDDAVEESRFSRYDFNGDGTADASDLDVMKSVWGQCTDGSSYEPDVTVDELEGLIRSVDLWIPVDQDGVGWVGDHVGLLEVSEAVDGFVLWTVPVSACTGTLTVRLVNADGVQVFETSDVVVEGQDIVVDGGELKHLDSDTPLVHWVSSSDHYGLVRYSSSGTVTNGVEISTSDVQMTTVHRSGVVAGEGEEGLNLILAGESTVTEVSLSSLSDDYQPWFWAEDGSGVLGRNTTDIQENTELIYVDAVNLAVGVVGPDFHKRWGDWPAIDPGGRIWLTGYSGGLYVVPTRGSDGTYDEWLDELEGGATCADGEIILPDPVRVDAFTSGHWRLVHTAGSPISVDGHVLVTDDTSLVVMSADGQSTLELDSAWSARGGEEMVYFWPGDGVGWSGDGRYVAWLGTDGVYLADLGSSTWAFPTSADITFLGDHGGGTLAVAPFSKRLVVGTFQGGFQDPWMELQLLDFSGNEVSSSMRHDLRFGNPAFSGTGSQLVYVDELSANKPNIVVVDTSNGNAVVHSSDWGPGWQGWVSWGVEIPHY